MIFRCAGKEDCNHRPYAEIFFKDNKGKSEWCYLCLWHFIPYRIKRKGLIGWCKVDTDRELMERMMEEIWDIQSDIHDIKNKRYNYESIKGKNKTDKRFNFEY